MIGRREDRRTVLSHYFSEIREFPLLTKDEERELAREIRQGSQDAIDVLVESNLSFVAKVASEYRYLGIPFEDLLNEGNVGLIEAAHRFDASKDTKFISYAIWWIRKSILKALSDQSGVVRLPYSQMKKVKEIRRAEQSLRKSLGRRPTREEISVFLERSVRKIDKVLQHTVHEVSLDEPIGDDQETSLSDCLEDMAQVSQEQRMLDAELTVGVGEIFQHLSAQQKTVIAHRFGLDGGPTLTLQETGDRMGLSRERVRQIECQAKERMRRLFRKRQRYTPSLGRTPSGRAESPPMSA